MNMGDGAMNNQKMQRIYKTLTLAGQLCVMLALLRLSAHSALSGPANLTAVLVGTGGLYAAIASTHDLGIMDGVQNTIAKMMHDRIVCTRGPRCQEREVRSYAAKEADRP